MASYHWLFSVSIVTQRWTSEGRGVFSFVPALPSRFGGGGGRVFMYRWPSIPLINSNIEVFKLLR